MDYIFSACSILHNGILEEREREENMGKKRIISIDPDEEVMLVRHIVVPLNTYEEAVVYRDSADRVEDRREYDTLHNALVDSMWKRHGMGQIDEYNIVEIKEEDEDAG